MVFAVLELLEDVLEGAENARGSHARVTVEQAEAPPEHVQVPENLEKKTRCFNRVGVKSSKFLLRLDKFQRMVSHES